MARVLTDDKHYIDIASAIREKNGTSDTYKPRQMADAIRAIKSGGGGGSGAAYANYSKKYVNFFDYDGTLLYAWTPEETAAATSLPELPKHEGLICQGWNWTLAEIQREGKEVDVGATYITDDGKTRLYIYVENDGRMDYTLNFTQFGVANAVIIDWGDGTPTETFSGSDDDATLVHTYSATGHYVITFTPVGSNSYSLGHGSYEDAVFPNLYNRKTLKKVEIGSNITSIGYHAFHGCSVETVTIPNSVTTSGSAEFVDTRLRFLVYPRGLNRNIECSQTDTLIGVSISPTITQLNGTPFYECYALESIVIPNSVTEIGNEAFLKCFSLHSVSFSKKLTTVGLRAFKQCISLSTLIFDSSNTIIFNDSAFESCEALTVVIFKGANYELGDDMFRDCPYIKYVDISKCTYSSISGGNTTMLGDTPPLDLEIWVASAELWAFQGYISPWKSSPIKEHLVGV